MKKSISFLAAFFLMSTFAFSQDTTSMKQKRTKPPMDTTGTGGWKDKDHKGKKKNLNADTTMMDKTRPAMDTAMRRN